MNLANKRYYPPGRYPEGWYIVEIARNLPKGGLLQKEWMGQQIVAWRHPALLFSGAQTGVRTNLPTLQYVVRGRSTARAGRAGAEET